MYPSFFALLLHLHTYTHTHTSPSLPVAGEDHQHPFAAPSPASLILFYSSPCNVSTALPYLAYQSNLMVGKQRPMMLSVVLVAVFAKPHKPKKPCRLSACPSFTAATEDPGRILAKNRWALSHRASILIHHRLFFLILFYLCFFICSQE